ncbi:MAG: leucine-rich repeat protein [Lachnospiraceae bacterium]|nr:leucine-rich repeat protein [Lachnospiraceae bacterium]
MKKAINTLTDLRRTVSIGLFIFIFMAFCRFINPLHVYAATYEYDELGRVTRVTYEDGTSVAYTYDANGNLTEVITYTNEEGEVTEPDDKPTGGEMPSVGGGTGNTNPSTGNGNNGGVSGDMGGNVSAFIPQGSGNGNGFGTGSSSNRGDTTGIGSRLGQGVGSLTNKNTNSAPYVGKTIRVGDGEYRITSINGETRTVQFVRLTKDDLTLYQVPDYIEYQGKRYLVTSVGTYAFAENTTLREVILGKNITSIGNCAFYNCEKLRHIKIWSDRLIFVGKDAYKGIHKRAAVCIGKIGYTHYRLGTKERGVR